MLVFEMCIQRSRIAAPGYNGANVEAGSNNPVYNSDPCRVSFFLSSSFSFQFFPRSRRTLLKGKSGRKFQGRKPSLMFSDW